MSFLEPALQLIYHRISRNVWALDSIRHIVMNRMVAEKRIIAHELAVQEGERFLDVGCGTGTFVSCFPDSTYVGIDIAQIYVQHAHKKYDCKACVMDGRALGLPNGHFDKVLVAYVSHHLDDGEVKAVLREIRRVLKPKGRLLIVEALASTPATGLLGRFVRYTDQGGLFRSSTDHVRLFGAYFDIEERYYYRAGLWDCEAFVLSPRPDAL